MMKRPEEERKKWLEGCMKEILNFDKRKVYKVIPLEMVPVGRRLIGSKWVFKFKRNGTYRSRLVALGYSQVPFVDFTDCYSPTVSEATMRICIILWMVFDLDVDQMDIESAFLEGILEPKEYVYMRTPQGFNIGEGKCLLIQRGMYGLKQVARTYYYTVKNYLCSEEVGFKACPSDECLFYKMGKRNIILIIVWVDDSIVFGNREDIADLVEVMRERFTIKTEGGLNDFLGCEIMMNSDKDKCWVHQPHLVKSLMTKFGKSLGGRNPKTPGTPGLVLRKVTDDDNESTKLDTVEHRKFQSGTGSLIYLLKHSRPELSNSIRELTKGMHKSGRHHMNELF